MRLLLNYSDRLYYINPKNEIEGKANYFSDYIVTISDIKIIIGI